MRTVVHYTRGAGLPGSSHVLFSLVVVHQADLKNFRLHHRSNGVDRFRRTVRCTAASCSLGVGISCADSCFRVCFYFFVVADADAVASLMQLADICDSLCSSVGAQKDTLQQQRTRQGATYARSYRNGSIKPSVWEYHCLEFTGCQFPMHRVSHELSNWLTFIHCSPLPAKRLLTYLFVTWKKQCGEKNPHQVAATTGVLQNKPQ